MDVFIVIVFFFLHKSSCKQIVLNLIKCTVCGVLNGSALFTLCRAPDKREL